MCDEMQGSKVNTTKKTEGNMQQAQRPNNPELHGNAKTSDKLSEKLQQNKKSLPLTAAIQETKNEADDLMEQVKHLQKKVSGEERPMASENLRNDNMRNILKNIVNRIEYVNEVLNEINSEL